MSFYSFVRGIGVKLGTGVSDLGFKRPSSVPIQSMYGPRYNVQRSFAPNSPGFVKLRQEVVAVSLLGDTGRKLGVTPRGMPLAQPKK